ncbi:hypothetical protein TVAG_012530 [Trichomonas vaginalis G3]|uniref:Uncharacterized protein n=1 Tax=Trichomonas vaginalis (strain ATCC PRA-98 / G3) TaxID=412133 RepID=A2E903_TRIV3|nr:uncharacterized protein TVAGG3_1075290 [Trichomonas vaginalis G3]EAY10887.1 hypothetical protein TVAG_012530 [Trichomonas vaginalis G3]KAI5482934.1 hypothetical protein TVAGG3_1075290 [Trichomonas vaginalis G3]|eukprot:XP_001323110.1 hypothetical protein [Trichomonas vaginalis G3]
MLLFLTLILYSLQDRCHTSRYINRKWKLADGRSLIVYDWTEYCHVYAGKQTSGTSAYISDGTKEDIFDKTSGTVKLADGRTAYVGEDKYLRVMSDNVEKIVTIKLYSHIDFW